VRIRPVPWSLSDPLRLRKSRIFQLEQGNEPAKCEHYSQGVSINNTPLCNYVSELCNQSVLALNGCMNLVKKRDRYTMLNDFEHIVVFSPVRLKHKEYTMAANVNTVRFILGLTM
jgi:hypothetical protein